MTTKANGRDVRTTRDMQGTHKGKTEHPEHVEEWSNPPKMLLPLKTFKLEKKQTKPLRRAPLQTPISTLACRVSPVSYAPPGTTAKGISPLGMDT